MEPAWPFSILPASSLRPFSSRGTPGHAGKLLPPLRFTRLAAALRAAKPSSTRRMMIWPSNAPRTHGAYAAKLVSPSRGADRLKWETHRDRSVLCV